MNGFLVAYDCGNAVVNESHPTSDWRVSSKEFVRKLTAGTRGGGEGLRMIGVWLSLAWIRCNRLSWPSGHGLPMLYSRFAPGRPRR